MVARLRLIVILVAACMLAAVACAAPPGTPDPGGGTTSGPTTGGPAGDARPVFFDPQDLSTPDARLVLRTWEDVVGYLRWLRTHPAPGRASTRLIAALQPEPRAGEALVLIARTVGCDSVGRAELLRQGTDLRLVARDVQHHPECLRANHLVAVYGLPTAAVPEGTTIDGSPPQPPPEG